MLLKQLLAAFLLVSPLATARADEISNIDLGWKFHLGNAAEPSKDFGYGLDDLFAKAGYGPSAVQTSFNDSGWRTVNLPHDWAIELPFVVNDEDIIAKGSKPLGGKYPATSIGWYRHTFNLTPEDAKKKISLEFDGVFRDSQVWVNGFYAGRHQSGYTGFNYPINDFLNYNSPNVITVRVDATQNEGWFYEGAGIYRHVWLMKQTAAHVTRHGVYVVPTVKGSDGSATVSVEVANESDKPATIPIQAVIRTPSGFGRATAYAYAKAVPPHATATAVIKMDHVFGGRVDLWSPEHPSLYSVDVRLTDAAHPLAGKETAIPAIQIGFRSLVFDKDKGLYINGKRTEILGTCNHQDHAGIGSALPDSINYYRIRKLKEMGCNAIRTSHNPPTPALLDACDKLGLVVMDENRLLDSDKENLDQMQELVTRDRNHPCVIMWSIGNEEPIASTDYGRRIAISLKHLIHQYDATRPITYAGNNGNRYEGTNEAVDLRGWNYISGGSTNKYHQEHPSQPIFGSEEASTLSTRGEYKNDPVKGYVSAYDVNKPGWGTLAEEWWKYYNARPFLEGAFVWTGFDYRGEPTPYAWPCISSHFGIMDTCGFPKDNYYYYKAHWIPDEPLVHLLPHWNWPGKEGKPIEVWAQTNCPEVELFLNGKSQGRKTVEALGHAVWTVNYEPGTLSAVGYAAGGKTARDKVVTSGKATRLIVVPDRTSAVADGEDALVFDITAVDASGNRVPFADNDLHFSITGDAVIAGAGNGDPSDHDLDVAISTPQRLAIDKFSYWPLKNSQTPEDTLPVDLRAVQIPDVADATPGHKYVDVSNDPYTMKEPNTTGLFQTGFEVTQEQINSGLTNLSIGMIDDLGWVYINNKLVATTKDWNQSYNWDVAKYLVPGRNTLAVWVVNKGGSGGIGHGISLSGPDIPAHLHRRLFNGNAQVIVRTGTKPGPISLTVNGDGLASSRTSVSTTAPTTT